MSSAELHDLWTPAKEGWMEPFLDADYCAEQLTKATTDELIDLVARFCEQVSKTTHDIAMLRQKQAQTEDVAYATTKNALHWLHALAAFSAMRWDVETLLDDRRVEWAAVRAMLERLQEMVATTPKSELADDRRDGLVLFVTWLQAKLVLHAARKHRLPPLRVKATVSNPDTTPDVALASYEREKRTLAELEALVPEKGILVLEQICAKATTSAANPPLVPLPACFARAAAKKAKLLGDVALEGDDVIQQQQSVPRANFEDAAQTPTLNWTWLIRRARFDLVDYHAGAPPTGDVTRARLHLQCLLQDGDAQPPANCPLASLEIPTKKLAALRQALAPQPLDSNEFRTLSDAMLDTWWAQEGSVSDAIRLRLRPRQEETTLQRRRFRALRAADVLLAPLGSGLKTRIANENVALALATEKSARAPKIDDDSKAIAQVLLTLSKIEQSTGRSENACIRAASKFCFGANQQMMELYARKIESEGGGKRATTCVDRSQSENVVQPPEFIVKSLAGGGAAYLHLGNALTAAELLELWTVNWPQGQQPEPRPEATATRVRPTTRKPLLESPKTAPQRQQQQMTGKQVLLLGKLEHLTQNRGQRVPSLPPRVVLDRQRKAAAAVEGGSTSSIEALRREADVLFARHEYAPALGAYLNTLLAVDATLIFPLEHPTVDEELYHHLRLSLNGLGAAADAILAGQLEAENTTSPKWTNADLVRTPDITETKATQLVLGSIQSLWTLLWDVSLIDSLAAALRNSGRDYLAAKLIETTTPKATGTAVTLETAPLDQTLSDEEKRRRASRLLAYLATKYAGGGVIVGRG